MPEHIGRLAWIILICSMTAVACESGDVDTDLPVEALEIEVTSAGPDPNEVTVRAPDRYQLIVTNLASEECLFEFGPYVNAFEIPAGEASEIEFVVPPDDPGGELAMGCTGGPQGRVNVLTEAVP